MTELDISERCECGGIAKFHKIDKFNNFILKCQKCKDTFDAHEDTADEAIGKLAKMRMRK